MFFRAFLSQKHYPMKRAYSQAAAKLYADLDNLQSPLRQQAKHVKFPLDEATRDACAQLRATFAIQEHGVGLAAPQLGISKQIIIASIPEAVAQQDPSASHAFPPTVLINPELIPRWLYGKADDWEVCLSDRYYAALVSRYRVVSYNAFDEQGVAVAGTATGLLARVLQHECDHLQGKMARDSAKQYHLLEDIYDIPKLGQDDDYVVSDNPITPRPSR